MNHNDTRFDRSGSRNQANDTETGHVYWLLQAALTSPAGSWTFDERARERITRHLDSCEMCRDRLDALDATLLGNREALSPDADSEAGMEAAKDRKTHSATGRIPGDAALADYAAALAILGRSAAARRYRAVARHIAACAICQETVAEISDGLAEDIAESSGAPDASRAASDPTSSTALDAPVAWWLRFAGGVSRLRQPFRVEVRPHWLAVIHDLPQFLAPALPVQSASFREPAGDAQRANVSSQAVVLDLYDEAAPPDRWARVAMRLRAQLSHRVSGELRYTWQTASGFEEPARDIPWSIGYDVVQDGGALARARALPALSTPLRNGASNARGISHFFLDESGDYILSISIERRLWIVPFAIRHLANGRETQSVDAPQTLRQPDSGAYDADVATMREVAPPQRPLDLEAPGFISTDITTVITGPSIGHETDDSSGVNTGEPQRAGAPAAGSRAPFFAGQRLTDFATVDVTVERIETGGFSIVAMGPDRLRGMRWIALKTLNREAPGLSGAHQTERLHNTFIQEGLTSLGLWPHPNVLGVIDLVEINEQPFLVLDYAEQGSLRNLFTSLRRQRKWLPFTDGLELAQHISRGILALHTPDPDLLRPYPIIHGDLKPENILLDRAGYARISDMGRLLRWASGISGEGTAAEGAYVTGTPPYMAPEQWRGIAHIAQSTDVYAFGIVLAELLTGRHPLLDLAHPHSLDDWRKASLQGHPIPLRQLGGDLFPAERAALSRQQAQSSFDLALERVEWLLTELLAKQMEARPSLHDALEELMAVARLLGVEPYAPPEMYARTALREQAHWRRWAVAYAHFRQPQEAFIRIERSLDLAPENPEILVDYADILTGMEQFDRATAMYQRALTHLPERDRQIRSVALLGLGNVLSQTEHYAEAEATYAEALALSPGNAALWFHRALVEAAWAQAEAQAGRLVEARNHVSRGMDYVERAIALNPDNADYSRCAQRLRALRDTLWPS